MFEGCVHLWLQSNFRGKQVMQGGSICKGVDIPLFQGQMPRFWTLCLLSHLSTRSRLYVSTI